MKAIGGYFELELNRGVEYHTGAIRLNTGRNAFEYILRAKKVKKVFLPYFVCDALLQPVERTGVDYGLYKINQNFEPIFNFEVMGEHDYFVYINYFGLTDHLVKKIAKICRNTIIDNSQAFFARPLKGIDTFYSPRKFFGLPDGAYLFSDKSLGDHLPCDQSSSRFEHLLKRCENEPENAYQVFVENDKKLSNIPIRHMSDLTLKLLANIRYAEVAKKRKANFHTLDKLLGKINDLRIDLVGDAVPLTYPFLTSHAELRKQLEEQKIYTALYWPNVLKWAAPDSVEHHYASSIVHLPIDQRYSTEEIKQVAAKVKQANSR